MVVLGDLNARVGNSVIEGIVGEFLIYYSHTEWYLLFFDSATTCAQETFNMRYLVG